MSTSHSPSPSLNSSISPDWPTSPQPPHLPDPSAHSPSPSPSSDPRQLFGMVETWAMAVLRDVPFSDWAVQKAASLTPFIDFLNTLEHAAPTDSEGMITPGTVFRGAGVDEEKGSYVSQYLLLPFDYGSLRVEQKYRVEKDTASSVTHEGWLAIQQGEAVNVRLRVRNPARPPFHPPSVARGTDRFCLSRRKLLKSLRRSTRPACASSAPWCTTTPCTSSTTMRF